MELAVGKLAPEIELKSHLGDTVRLSNFRDQCNVVLVFFPLAWTPV
jgi:peroxiredoxin